MGDHRGVLPPAPAPPPALCETQQAELKAAVQELPAMAGIELANWTLPQAQEEGGLVDQLLRLGLAIDPASWS